MMLRKPIIRNGTGKVELLFFIAVLALVFQLFPSLGTGLGRIIDIRTWSRAAWFAVNITAVIGLLTARFGPSLYEEWTDRNVQRQLEREKQRKAREVREQREMLERIKNGRARRVY